MRDILTHRGRLARGLSHDVAEVPRVEEGFIVVVDDAATKLDADVSS